MHLPDVPEQAIALEACALARKTVVPLDQRPPIVITADAVVENGIVRCLKDEVDEEVPRAERVIVFSLIGDTPLAPTMDAYLDITMAPGRDIWADQVGASG